MSTISTTLEISLISLVTPSDSPQVPNADMTSKNTCKNVSLPFSVADIISIPKNVKIVAIVNTANER